MSFHRTHTPTKPTEKAKWQVPMRLREVTRVCKDGRIVHMPSVEEYYLEGDLLKRFCREFPKHSNRRIMEWFGISFSTLQRFKRELHLTKNMKAVRKEQAEDTKRICEENGWYDSLRGKAPSEACREGARKLRASGFVPILQLKKKNRRKYNKLMQRNSERRQDLLESEKKRVRLGLTPLTKIPSAYIGEVRKYTKAESHKRYYALNCGYVLSKEPEDRYNIFYDKDTVRRAKFEALCIETGFKILEWKDYDIAEGQ